MHTFKLGSTVAETYRLLSGSAGSRVVGLAQFSLQKKGLDSTVLYVFGSVTGIDQVCQDSFCCSLPLSLSLS